MSITRIRLFLPAMPSWAWSGCGRPRWVTEAQEGHIKLWWSVAASPLDVTKIHPLLHHHRHHHHVSWCFVLFTCGPLFCLSETSRPFLEHSMSLFWPWMKGPADFCSDWSAFIPLHLFNRQHMYKAFVICNEELFCIYFEIFVNFLVFFLTKYELLFYFSADWIFLYIM